jgi:hypothetical protein
MISKMKRKVKFFIKDKRIIERLKLTYILLSGREYYHINSANTEDVNEYIASRVKVLHDIPPHGSPMTMIDGEVVPIEYEDWMRIIEKIEVAFRKMKRKEESKQSKKCIEGLNLFIVHLSGLWD